MIALLPVERDVLIAEPLEALERKRIVRTLGLLQAQHVRPHRLDELGDEIDAQADRIDVPGGDVRCMDKLDRVGLGASTGLSRPIHVLIRERA